jgi:hypothetical protein
MLTGEGRGVGEKPNHIYCKKAWSSIKYSILSAVLYTYIYSMSHTISSGEGGGLYSCCSKPATATIMENFNIFSNKGR